MKVAIEQAKADIERWLNYKKVGNREREDQEDAIQSLINAVSDGLLVVDNDCNLIQELKFPTEGELPVSKLEFKPRIKLSTVHSHLQGVKANDGDGRLLAYVAALTGKPKDVIKALDTGDYKIGQSIAIFFL